MKSGKQRSVWMTDEEWLSIKESAKLSRRTISQYLLFLHQSDVQVFPKTVEDDGLRYSFDIK